MRAPKNKTRSQKKTTTAAPVSRLDPLNVNKRLYRQVAALLDQLEDDAEGVTLKERYMALAAIARIQYIFVNLRKEKLGDEPEGSAVRKYAGAFKANDPRGGAQSGRGPAAVNPGPEPDDDWFERDSPDNDDDAA